MSDWSAQHSTLSAIFGLDVSSLAMLAGSVQMKCTDVLICIHCLKDDDAWRHYIQLRYIVVGRQSDSVRAQWIHP